MSLSAGEQYLLELINRARLDPAAEAQRYGLGLNAGLTAGTIDTSAKQVLAPNEQLEAAATQHSAWMLQADAFSHTGAGGSDAGARMQAADYQFTGSWTWRENLAWVGSTGNVDMQAAITQHHEGLYRSEGHRVNTFAENLREIGIGQVAGAFSYQGTTYNSSMLTEKFASSGSDVYVTGVAYRDADRDHFYSIGEGQSGYWVRSNGAGDTTAGAGGYAIAVNAQDDLRVAVGRGNTILARIDIDTRDGNAKVDLVTEANGTKSLALSASATLVTGISHASLLGVADLDLTGHAGANTLTGNSGDNEIAGRQGNDKIWGLAGADWLDGGFGADQIYGGQGADMVIGRAGNDDLYGEGGNDRIWAGDGDDRLVGGTGHDVLRGENGHDRMFGGEGNDTMFGNAGRDRMDGGVGHDRMFGGKDIDTMIGRAGDDQISGEDGNDIIWAGDGNDWADGGNGHDIMRGGGGHDRLIGRGGNDTLVGDGGRDRLDGCDGNDKLYGGAGNDRLDGGGGDDRMEGGANADTFVFSGGRDAVVDFENDIDTILIHNALDQSRDLNVQDILDIGTISNGNAVFDLHDGHVLTVLNVSNLDILANDLVII